MKETVDSLVIPMPNVGEVSNGVHTFNELYDHRHILVLALMALNKGISWMAYNHADGSAYSGWFLVGLNLKDGQVTYHLPNRYLEAIEIIGIAKIDHAPEWDGHDSYDVINRIAKHFLK